MELTHCNRGKCTGRNADSKARLTFGLDVHRDVDERFNELGHVKGAVGVIVLHTDLTELRIDLDEDQVRLL